MLVLLIAAHCSGRSPTYVGWIPSRSTKQATSTQQSCGKFVINPLFNNEVSITSNNTDIVNKYGRVVKQPTETTCVTYTITFTKDGQSQSMTLSSMVKGRYVDR